MSQVSILNVTNWQQVPGSNTYFRTSDVTPEFTRDGALRIFNSRGDRRSWGTPSVNSSIYRLADDVIAVDVVGWHKHTVSPVGGWFYFILENGQWVRHTANHKRIAALIAERGAGGYGRGINVNGCEVIH